MNSVQFYTYTQMTPFHFTTVWRIPKLRPDWKYHDNSNCVIWCGLYFSQCPQQNTSFARRTNVQFHLRLKIVRLFTLELGVRRLTSSVWVIKINWLYYIKFFSFIQFLLKLNSPVYISIRVIVNKIIIHFLLCHYDTKNKEFNITNNDNKQRNRCTCISLHGVYTQLIVSKQNYYHIHYNPVLWLIMNYWYAVFCLFPFNYINHVNHDCSIIIFKNKITHVLNGQNGP